MSEAVWIELIKVLPAFLWIAFGFIVLAVAKRIFTAQAPRMTKVETPWVTVELAQQVIEQAAARGPVAPPVPEPAWPTLYPLPTQQVPPGARTERGTESVYGHPLAAVPLPPQSPPVADAAEEEPDDTVHTEPPTEARPARLATPPADAPAEGTDPPEQDPHATVTAPNQQIPNIPPTFPVLAPPNGNGNAYYAPMPGQNAPYWSQPAPAYQQPPAYQPAKSDNRSLRAATKLALAAGDLKGGAILWVDDHPEWNDSLIRLFRTVGITVDTALSTRDAVRALGRRSYDLVISDMRREAERDGDTAGTRLLDNMISVGIPTPAVFFSENTAAHTAPHPRAITTTNSPEKLVDIVVEFVGDLRAQQSSSSSSSSWLGRLTGN